jgi:phosphoglycolate phosphatase
VNIRPDIGGIAFDLDGTLIDSAPDIASALNSALAGAGLPGFDVQRVRAWVGDGPDVLIDRALDALGRACAPPALRTALRRGFDAATLAAPLQHGAVCDGVEALVEALRDVLPMVVVTNKPTPLARAVLKAAGLLDQMIGVFGADHAGLRKPEPGLLLGAAAHLGITPQRLLMVGDGAADLGAARAAGCPAALVGWGYGAGFPSPAGAAWRVATPEQLYERLSSAPTPI